MECDSPHVWSMVLSTDVMVSEDQGMWLTTYVEYGSLDCCDDE